MLSETLPVDFSIIVPTFNRPAQLSSCLRALSQLEFPRERFEVIIVDDGSTTLPGSVSAEYRGVFNLQMIRQEHTGQASARNVGAAHARARYLAFTDDDCAPAPDWLRAMSLACARSVGSTIGGRTINALENNVFSSASQVLTSFLYTRHNRNPDDAHFFATNNLVVPADRFRAMGGFDNSFERVAGEDRFFCALWRHLGFRMVYAPEMVVYHSHALSFSTFWKQHWNYGRGAVFYHQARARRGIGRFQVEPPSFYSDLLRFPFAGGTVRRPMTVLGLVVTSQVANALGYFAERIRHSASSRS